MPSVFDGVLSILGRNCPLVFVVLHSRPDGMLATPDGQLICRYYGDQSYNKALAMTP